jgi:hypothetical protein
MRIEGVEAQQWRFEFGVRAAPPLGWAGFSGAIGH